MDGVCLSIDLAGMQSLGPQPPCAVVLSPEMVCEMGHTSHPTLCMQLDGGCGHGAVQV